MCRTCVKAREVGLDLDDMITAVKVHGNIILPPNSPKQYAVGWDGRPLAVSKEREVAQAGVDKAHEEGQVGRWELLQQFMSPWEPATTEKPRVGAEFWADQR